MRRRDFIMLLGGAAAWPLSARAQQAGLTKRVGILMPLTADDPYEQARLAAFLQGLQEAGWSVGRNLRIDTRWGGGIEGIRRSAVELMTPIGDQHADEIERTITTFARSSNGGLIVVPNATTIVNRKLIISLAAKLHLPAIYGYRLFVTNGGLICYGPDIVDQCRRAAGYADRILRGEQPGNLPVQEPTKFELVVNVKTATALGLDVPPTVLARADEVIE